jgi:hypothetical protein
MEKQYIIKEYEVQDKHAALALMQEIFASEKMNKARYFNTSLWKWQYQDNPSGKAITIIAKHNENLISQYANIPVHLKIGAQVCAAAIVIDLMVKKNYRRLGLFKKMGDFSNNRLAQLNTAITIAFPSRKESCAGFINKLGWYVVGELDTLIKIINPLKKSQVIPLRQGFGGQASQASHVEVKEAMSFPDEINNLWDKLKDKINIAVVRDNDYLNWRYFKNPAGGYQAYLAYRDGTLLGYFVLKVTTVAHLKAGLVVDFLCVDDLEIMRELSAKINQLCARGGAYLCGILRTKLYEQKLRQLGFNPLARSLNPKKYTLIAREHQANLDTGAIKNLDNWYLSFGDWDVV